MSAQHDVWAIILYSASPLYLKTTVYFYSSKRLSTAQKGAISTTRSAFKTRTSTVGINKNSDSKMTLETVEKATTRRAPEITENSKNSFPVRFWEPPKTDPTTHCMEISGLVAVI